MHVLKTELSKIKNQFFNFFILLLISGFRLADCNVSWDRTSFAQRALTFPIVQIDQKWVFSAFPCWNSLLAYVFSLFLKNPQRGRRQRKRGLVGSLFRCTQWLGLDQGQSQGPGLNPCPLLVWRRTRVLELSFSLLLLGTTLAGSWTQNPHLGIRHSDRTCGSLSWHP